MRWRISSMSPLLIMVRRGRGGKIYQGFWIASTVSRALYHILLLLLLNWSPGIVLLVWFKALSCLDKYIDVSSWREIYHLLLSLVGRLNYSHLIFVYGGFALLLQTLVWEGIFSCWYYSLAGNILLENLWGALIHSYRERLGQISGHRRLVLIRRKEREESTEVWLNLL